MKGEVQPGPVVLNKWKFEVDTLPPFYARKAGPFEKEIGKAEAPDTTNHSSGRAMAGELTFETPMHHDAEYAALEAWFTACEFGAPGYKKAVTVTALAADGQPRRIYELAGLWLTKRSVPELDRTSDDLGFVTWTASYDDVIVLQ